LARLDEGEVLGEPGARAARLLGKDRPAMIVQLLPAPCRLPLQPWAVGRERVLNDIDDPAGAPDVVDRDGPELVGAVLRFPGLVGDDPTEAQLVGKGVQVFGELARRVVALLLGPARVVDQVRVVVDDDVYAMFL